MERYPVKRYNAQVLLIMAAYALLVYFEWPHVKTVADPGFKIVLALVPALPVVGVIVLMGARVLRSDELQQRLHLIALGVATGLVAALSVFLSFLCAAHVLTLAAEDVLFWIFPALCFVYGLTRLALSRRYGGTSC